MLMPKTPMYKNSLLLFSAYNVRPSRQVFGMEPKAITKMMNN
jgi:hypothetical protein